LANNNEAAVATSASASATAGSGGALAAETLGPSSPSIMDGDDKGDDDDLSALTP
jgi:hypothetical protein